MSQPQPSTAAVAVTTAGGPQAAKALAGELIAGWDSTSASFNAQSLLNEHPELREFKSAVLDLAYEEYCRRDEAGEKLEPEEFARRFPGVQRSLLRLIEVHRYFEDDPRLRPDPLDESSWPHSGDEWLQFQLLEELGRGAFSRVFLARESTLGNRLVVVKATIAGAHEAHAAGQLQHPNIVPVFSVQTDPASGLAAVCMPFLGRATLFDVLEAAFSGGQPPSRVPAILEGAANPGGSASPRPASRHRGLLGSWSYVEAIIQLGSQVADALAFTHAHGILHCDVKPSNVLVTAEGRALLFDFNLAFRGCLDEALVGGTLPYMAPEQLVALRNDRREGERSIDRRTDIFGLGATLYELLCGRLPFGPPALHLNREQLTGRLLERQQSGPAPLRNLNPNVDGRIAGLIERCLEFDPEKRPATADELAASLRRQLTPTRRVWRRIASHRRRLALVAGVSAGLATGLAFYVSGLDPYPVRELHRAERALDKAAYAEAAAHLSNAVRSDPELLQAHFLRGYVGLCTGDFETAHVEFKFLQNRVHDGRVAACLAHLAAEFYENDNAAIALYEQAISLGYESAAVWSNLGYCHARRANLDRAVDCLERAIEIDPRLQAAHYNRARIEFRRAIKSEGPPDTRHIESALQIGPETAGLDFDAALTLALLAARTDDGPDSRDRLLSQALDYCERAIERGLPPERLAALSGINPAVESDIRFGQLQSRSAPGTVPKPFEGLTLVPVISNDVYHALVANRSAETR